ncbi:MAG: hypothetical protein QOK05_922 [Chloroflexota bacterium]|jgi:hypothetical protein|nr:hypothetical protein [Chloroflexota bacterium]
MTGLNDAMMRRLLPRGAAGLALTTLGFVALSAPASASTPSDMHYGWWTQAAAGGLGGAIAPDVPADGLLVQNSPSAPVAMAAISFSVPDGGTATIKLDTAGHPVMTQPPQACLLTSPFTPSEGGAWTDRPTYDCKAPLAGQASGTSITFAATSLARGGRVAVAILAVGAGDRIAFAKPVVDIQAPPPQQAVAPEPVPQPGGVVDTGATVPPIPAPAFVPGVINVGPPPAPTSAVAPPPVAAVPNTLPRVITRATPSSLRGKVGTYLGMALLLAAIVYWADGFGVIALRTGGRSSLKASPG